MANMICWQGALFPSLLLILLTNHKCLSEHSQCNYSSSLDNIINVTIGLSKGLKSLSPFYTDTVEKCLNSCCSDLPKIDGHLCNFMTFAPKNNTSPNCYLFHCPNKDACPTMSLKGYTSYVIDKDQESEMSAMKSHSQNGEGSSDSGIAGDLRGSGSDLPSRQDSTMQSTTTTHLPPPTVQSRARSSVVVPTLPPPNVLPATSSTAAPVTTAQLLVTTTSPVTTRKSPAATVRNSLSLTSTKTVPTGLPVAPSTSTRTTALSTTQSLRATSLQTTTTEPTMTTTLPTTPQASTIPPPMPTTVPTTLHTTTTEPTMTSTRPTTLQASTTKMFTTLPTTLQTTTTPSTLATTLPSNPHTTTTEPTMTTTLPTTLQTSTTPPPMPTTLPTTLQASTTESRTSTTLPTTLQTTTTLGTMATTLPSTLHTTTLAAVITTHPTSTTTAPNTTASTSGQTTTSWTMPPLPEMPLVTTIILPTTYSTTTIYAVSTRKPIPHGTLQSSVTRVPEEKTPFITNISAVSNNASVNKKDGGEQDQRQNVGGQEESAGKVGDSQMEMKSGLIAALAFGVLFLTITVAMLSKQLIDSYKRRDYTKMDFLMNGMYVQA